MSVADRDDLERGPDAPASNAVDAPGTRHGIEVSPTDDAAEPVGVVDAIDAMDADATNAGDATGSWIERLTAGRAPWRAVVLFLGTVVAALVTAAPVVWLAGSNPLEAYRALFQGSLGSQRGIAETLVSATPLLAAGLAVALAFRGGLFNIGVEGQLIIGGLTAGALGAELDLPTGAHVVVAVGGGALAGALWALVPGLLKAWRGVHEVITTIMMNYIAFAVSTYLVSPGGLLVSDTQPSATEKVRPTADLPRIWDPTRLHAGVLVVLVVAVLLWWFLFRTPAGFRLRIVGANPTAATFNGIRPGRVTVWTMCLSGSLAGLAGAVEVLGLHGRYFDAFSPGYGFDSIAVALLGALNPLGVVVAALLFGMLRAGSVLVQARAGVPRDVITVISGLIVAFVAGRVAFERRLARRAAGRRAAASATASADPSAPPDAPRTATGSEGAT